MKGDAKKLREYIKNAVMEGDNSEILYEIDNDRIKPSKKACKTHCGNARKHPELNLIDDQKVASRESWSYLDRVKKMARAHAHSKRRSRNGKTVKPSFIATESERGRGIFPASHSR